MSGKRVKNVKDSKHRGISAMILILVLTMLPGAFPEALGAAGTHPGRHHSRETRQEEESGMLTFTLQPRVLDWVEEGGEREAPEVQVRVNVSPEASVSEITFRWYVGEEAAGEAETVIPDGGGSARSERAFPELTVAGTGVYPIRCEAAAVRETGQEESVSSWTVNYIVARGVQENSLIIFSDLHETWDNLGRALADAMEKNGGYLPDAVVATGDFANGYLEGEGEELQETFTRDYLDRIRLQLGGINTFWSAGNHDNSQAVRQAEETSLPEEGLIVVSFDYREAASGDPGRAALQAEMEDIAEDYQGEVILVAAHGGLHAVGVDPASRAKGVKPWAGGAGYSISGSAEVVQMLNEYALEYGMKIVFFFGHNHTRSEGEFRKSPGGRILSTLDGGSRTAAAMTLNFLYAHAGFLTDTRNGHERYTWMSWENGEVNQELRSLQ